MNNFKKIFLFVCSFILLFALLLITFPSQNQKVSTESIWFGVKDGLFSLVSEKNWTYSERSTPHSLWSEYFIERFWIFNSFLFSKTSKYKKSDSWTWKVDIALSDGEFFFDVGDMTKEVVLSGTGFIAQPLWGGRFFVSLDSSSKVTFFSLDSVIKIELTWTDDNSRETEVYLYPHMSFRFDSKRNSFLKNADRIRISSVQNFDYYYESISKGQVDSFTAQLSQLWFSVRFLKEAIFYQGSLFFQSKTLLGDITSSVSSFKMPWDYYIQKYKTFFLNPTKKKAYLKTLILADFISLLGGYEFQKSVYAEINEYFLQLEWLDKKESDDFKKELRPIVFLFLQSVDEKSIETKKQLMSFFNGTTQSHSSLYWTDSFLLLSQIFRKRDVWDDAENFYQWMVQFVDLYSKKIGIKGSSIHSSNQVKKTYVLDYFTFFLEKILVPDETTFVQSDFPALIQILNVYNTISYIVYWNGDESLARTAMFVNLELIKKILNLLNNSYFESKRDDKKLLVRKEDFSLSSQIIEMLKKNIDQIYTFFQDNKKFLSTKDGSKDLTLPSDYEWIYELYKEYFSALFDYNKYSIEYDAMKRWLLDIKNFSTDGSILISKENCIQYFSKFSWLDISSASITPLVDHYEVQDAFLNGQKISFEYYPNNAWEMTQISINWENKNMSYKLDLVQQAWKVSYDKATWKEKDKYKFGDFFLLTFLGQKEIEPVTVIDNSRVQVEEDSVIRVFKSTKLLSQKEWLWKDIQSLRIKYGDVSVTLENGTPNISLQNVLLVKTIDFRGTSTNFYALFSGKFYVDQVTSNHYFWNIKIKVFNNYEQNNTNLSFAWKEVQLIGSIPLEQTDEKIGEIAKIITRLQSVEIQLSNKYSLQGLDIKYFISQGKSILKFFANWESITLNMSGDYIESFNFSWKNILNNKIRYTEINNYIH